MKNRLPWHYPPSFDSGFRHYLLTAACYQHAPVIGENGNRMGFVFVSLNEIIQKTDSEIKAWVILPNHYHFLIKSPKINNLLKSIKQFHGRSSRQWNIEDGTLGRKVWHGVAETVMKSDRHYYSTQNYIHNNPVKHGYVTKWQDWPYSSASSYLETVGMAQAKKLWNGFPIDGYGDGWDDASL